MSSILFVIPIFILDDNKVKLITQSKDITNNFAKDFEISIQFLQQYSNSKETLRSYLKEIERLLVWCIYLGKVNISKLQLNHLISYQKFLKNPKSKNIWCGASVSKQDLNNKINPKWRLFVDNLSTSSIIKIYKILMIFFKYLVEEKYIINNPINKKHIPKRSKNKINNNYLELNEIQAILTALSDFQAQNKQYEFEVNRAKYVILLLFYTGLPAREIIVNNMNNFEKHNKNWLLRLSNKKLLPIHPDLMESWGNFKATINKSNQFTNQHPIPLIPNKDLKTSIKAKRINQIIKWAFNLGALSFEPHNLKIAFKLRKASIIWLQNSYIKFNL
jgi:site-specific recombinase XerD